MLIPLTTDAPVWHRPWCTIGIMALCLVIHPWTMQVADADPERLIPLLLIYGEWNPLQWITSVFLHEGWMHLLGNLLFLWAFGLVVEGQLGWWKFGLLYLAITVLSGGIEQTIMLGGEGGSLGASGVIFGLLAIVLLWAPENEVDCLWFIGIRIIHLEMQWRWFALWYIGWEVLMALLNGMEMSSAVLHLIGAATGVPLGIALLKLKVVDCEGWDLFSRMRRNRTLSPASAHAATQGRPVPPVAPHPTSAAKPSTATVPRPPTANHRQPVPHAAIAGTEITAKFLLLLEEQDHQAALALYRTSKEANSAWRAPSDALDRLARRLWRDVTQSPGHRSREKQRSDPIYDPGTTKQHDQAVTDVLLIAEDRIRESPLDADLTRLIAAAALLQQQRPRAAIEHLDLINPDTLPGPQREHPGRLRASAERQIADGALEF